MTPYQPPPTDPPPSPDWEDVTVKTRLRANEQEVLRLRKRQHDLANSLVRIDEHVESTRDSLTKVENKMDSLDTKMDAVALTMEGMRVRWALIAGAIVILEPVAIVLLSFLLKR